MFFRATVTLVCLLWPPYTSTALWEPLFLSSLYSDKCLFKDPRFFRHSSCIGSLRASALAAYVYTNFFHTWLTLLLWRWTSLFLLKWNIYQPTQCHVPEDGDHHFEAVGISNLV
jgi:hypothetical protein